MSGDGVYVSIDDNNVSNPAAGWVGGENILLEKYNQTFNLVTQTYADYQGFMTDLEGVLSGVDRDFTIDDVVSGINITQLSQSNLPAPPVVGTLPGFYEPGTTNAISFPTTPHLAPLPAVDFSFTAPVMPAAVNPSLGFQEIPYTSEMWLTVFTKVQDAIANPGSALGVMIEDGIWQRARDRQRIEGDIAYRKATQEISSRSLPFPQPAVRALEQEAGLEVLRQNTNLSFDIAAKQAEIANENSKFFIGKGVEIETMLRNFHTTFQTLSLEAKKAAADLVLRNYSEGVKGFSEAWRGIGIKMETGVKRIEAVIAGNKLLSDNFDIQARIVSAKIEMISKQRDGILQAAGVEAEVYKAEVQGLSSWYDALSSQQMAQLKKAELLVQQAVEEVKANLQSFLSGNSLKERVLESLSSLSAQVLASALNAINTSISHGTSGSKSVSESYGHSDSLTESHSYEHDPAA